MLKIKSITKYVTLIAE